MLTDYYDDIYEYGFGEGKTEGIDETRVEDIRSVMDSLEVTVQQAMNTLRIPASDRSKYLAML